MTLLIYLTISDTIRYGMVIKMPKKRNLKGTQVTYNGYVFTKDAKTGYYLSAKPIYNNKRIRLHRYVWIIENGEVPQGFDVHHKDEDKDNNEPDNLELMINLKHRKHHIDKIMVNHFDERREKFIKYAHPAAVEWHGSTEGRQWHSDHWNETLKIPMTTKIIKICTVCGAEYETVQAKNGVSQFCSKKCKAKARRDSGVDNETRNCVVCGKSFEINRYEDKITCSRQCAGTISAAKRLKRKVPAYGDGNGD